MENNSTNPPIALKVENEKTYHMVFKKSDPYTWLRANNWQEVLKHPQKLPIEIKEYLESENAYLEGFMEDTKNFQKFLFEEMKGRIKEKDSSVPEKDGEYYYGYAYTENAQHPDFFRSCAIDGEKDIYFSGDSYAQNYTYFQIGSVQHAPDHQKFSFTFDNNGSEFYTIGIQDFATKKDYSDCIKNSGAHIAWSADSKGFFYTKIDEHHRPAQIYYHKLGQKQTEDKLVFEEKDSGFFISLQDSKLHDYIYINVHDHETSEIWLLNAKNPDQEPSCVKPRQTGIEYSLTEGLDVFYILTNAENAKDFKIMEAPIFAPYFENWQEIVPPEDGRIILAIDAYENYLIWLERFDALPSISIMDRTTKELHKITFQEETYSLGLIGAREYYTNEIRFTYSSLTTPQKIFSYNMANKSRQLLKMQEVPSGHISENYITKRLNATAEDGALIPISLYYHKDTKLDGTAPCLIYGYGAYGISIPAQFQTNTLCLVNRGFVYAIAHIRGGKEKGALWYEKGKHHYKKNSFKDFISVGRYLVEQNYTSHESLVAYGGSAGGMLMGAVANMAPQDFKAIIALVPFVDVLNTMLDDTLPLTPPEWPEWGNPLKSKEDYALIASYSPYDNVCSQSYPNILAMAGLTDPRVTYWEAAKWIAKLRAEKTTDVPVFLKTNMDSGHAGASGRFTKLQETAFIYAYILKILGKNKA